MIDQFLPVIITTMLPVAELRGGIPLGIALGLEPFSVILTSIIVNCLIFFPIYFGLEFLYEDFFSRFSWARKLIERVQRKGHKYVDRYGILGLIIFVGIPSFLAVCLGVLISATIVSLAVFGLIGGAGLILR